MNQQDFLLHRIEILEFHQRLLIKLLSHPNYDFYRLVIEMGISEQEVNHFCHVCDELNVKLAEQKAEGFVHFHPLLNQLSASLPIKLKMEEVVKACLKQKMFEPLFEVLQKYL
ncbi:DUF1878 family protein [Neobacillus vireti]|uniref:DUF1878 family protein n=1 Tax=Neobacillus vireti TaxID=220686 RepID=UPI002FFD9504